VSSQYPEALSDGINNTICDLDIAAFARKV